MSVRTAGPADVEALAELRARWREAPFTSEFTVQFSTWFAVEQESRWWWLAEDESKQPIGMVNVKLFNRMPSPSVPASRWGYLANLYVVPERRGDGTGSALVAAAVDRARSEQLVRLVLAPSELAAPLYERHGFRAADELLLCPLG